MQLTFIIVVAYLLGSIPSGLLVGKLFHGVDVRTLGSKNMGSTNTFRTLGWKAGITVQVLDILKGIAAVAVARYVFSGNLPFPNMTPFEDITIVCIIAGIAAVLGHVWTIFAQFKGGKGINTALGMLIAIVPVEIAVALGVFLLVVLASGYVSLASMIAAASLPTTMMFRHTILGVEIQGYHTLIFFIIGIAVFLIYTHRKNIGRLMAGNENRFNKIRLLGGPKNGG